MNCNKALPQNGKVIIMDFIMPGVTEATNAAKYVSMFDNAMFIHPGGKERTEKQFEALCHVYNRRLSMDVKCVAFCSI